MVPPRVHGVSLRFAVLTIIAMLVMSASPAEARQWYARVQDPVLLELVKRGTQRSFTFRNLVAILERSDVLVHLRRTSEPRAGTGFTQFIVSRGGTRVVRITLNIESPTDAAVALLGHELQHAVELADKPLVADARAYEALYRLIGRQSCTRQGLCYDTRAAVDAGLRVLSELRG
jgi:hypothetical protein